MIGRIAIALGIGAIANFCPFPQPAEIRPAQVITIGEDYNFRFDARRGDFVIVVMNPRPLSAMLNSCDEIGGELISNPFTKIWTCEGIDF